ncbi:MAG: FAD-dependent oxidoreductase [Bacteroidota bacterium]
MRIGILGGGVAGVVTARELSNDPDLEIELLEKEDHLGGLQRSVEVNGAWYDIGAFVFDREHQLLRTFPELYEIFIMVDHSNKAIKPGGNLDYYPMTLHGYARDNGVMGLIIAALDLAYCKMRYWKRDNLIAYIKYYIGGTIYERSGLRSYIQRFYRTSDDTIDLEFGRQRLPGIRNECSLRNNARKIASRIFQRDFADQHWRCYVRPPEGFNRAYSTIGDILVARGVTIRAGREIRSINRRGDQFDVRFDDSERLSYDRIISTIPIATALDYIGRPIERDLEYMTLNSLFYRFRGEPGYDSAFLYNFTHDGDWKRITNFSHYYGPSRGDSYFSVESTLRAGEPRTLEEERDSFERHISRFPILRGVLDYQGGRTTPNAYPFFRRGDTERIGTARARLTEFGLELVGRQGTFTYSTAHQTAENAVAVAGKIRGPGERG